MPSRSRQNVGSERVMNTLPFHPYAPRTSAAPRGSRWAATVFLTLWRLARSMHGHASRPQVDATAEANHVRAIAMEIRRSDPRFADDLFAAADRHEQLHG